MSLKNEIFEQPGILAGLLSDQKKPVEKIVKSLQDHDIQYVYLAARGTSDNAARYAQYLLGAFNGVPVALATPSLFTRYEQPPALRGALVIGVSQSGQSPDIVGVLAEGKRQGRPTLAITNDVTSPLAQAADYIVDIQAGVEAAVAATKTYTAQLLALALFSATLRGEPARLLELESVPGWVEKVLELDGLVAEIAGKYAAMQRCVVLGRGYNYATVFEWSLKLKELAYVLAEPYSSADFQHGPVALVEKDFPVLSVAPAGRVFESMLALLRTMQKFETALAVISDHKDALDLARYPVPLPGQIPEWLTPLVAIAPAQLFSYYLTLARGFNPDSPRWIHKVTETE
jgi:glucosamine--fructose-6-phosphate aminotransferase (isomerizing)